MPGDTLYWKPKSSSFGFSNNQPLNYSRISITGLSANDKYVFGLIRLNLSNKDIAVIKGISAGSAKVMRYRLRKKMGLTPDTAFVSFLQAFEVSPKMI